MIFFHTAVVRSLQSCHPPVRIEVGRNDRGIPGLVACCVKTGPGIDPHSQAGEAFAGVFSRLIQKGSSRLPSAHFSHLHWTVFIHIPAGAVLSTPIQLRFVSEGKVHATHVVVVLDEGAQATVSESFQARSDLQEWSHGTEVTVARGARLTYATLAASRHGRMLSARRAEVVEGAAIDWHGVTIGGHGDEHDTTVRICGERATNSVDWMFYVRGSERQRVSMRNTFDAPEGRGEMTIRGVAQDTARGACDGMIEITERGRGTDTYLTERVLMLDPTATIDAVPGLEIRTNDVKASHSATVTRVTPEDLFYLKSRGLPDRLARRMFVEGFLSDLSERVVNLAVREEMLEALREAYERK